VWNFKVRVEGLELSKEFGIWGVELKGLGCGGFEFEVWGLGFEVWGLGFGV
jgi:hypothetical protein